ncbi:DUF3768 domain-containing protein [bacterium]|nr:MAG: DUF3768 domain-containing protein [bacterium]
MKIAHVTQIAHLNDTFRRGGFGVMVTKGVRELGDAAGIMRAVREFNTFSEDNDPHGEHDFGTIMWLGEKLFWKIDYYDAKLEFGEYPLSQKCRRVLTVMLANEY